MSKILIVEDEEAIADLEKDYLELSGFEVEIEHRVMWGMGRRAGMSKAPWCVGPSSPTSPARSRQRTTGRLSRAASWMILS